MSRDYEIGRAEKDDFSELMEMMSESFSYVRAARTSLDRMLPDLYSPTDPAEGCNHVIRCGGKIVSTVGCFRVPLLVCGQKTSIAGVGGVCTLPEFRGRGYMHALLDVVMSEIASGDCAFAFLGGERRRYMAWGFECVVNQYCFRLSSHTEGAKACLAGDPIEIHECAASEADWSAVWKQAQKNSSISACGRESLQRKYDRADQRLFYVDDPDGAHVLVHEKGSQRELRAWAGDPELVGAIMGCLLNRGWDDLNAYLPWYPDQYRPVLKNLMRDWSMVSNMKAAVVDLAKTLELFKPHFDRCVQMSQLKGSVRLAMGPSRQVPAQEVVLEADGRELLIAPATGTRGKKVELSCREMVELLLNPYVAGWSLMLDPGLQWVADLFPVPLYVPRLYDV